MALPASMASLMYPAIFAAMVVTQREPPLLERALAATPRDSFWPVKSTRPPAVKALPRCALAGTAERDARDTRVCFTPTGARPAIVTLIAAMVSGVYVKYAYGWNVGVGDSADAFHGDGRGRSDRHTRVCAHPPFSFTFRPACECRTDGIFFQRRLALSPPLLLPRLVRARTPRRVVEG